MAEYYRLNAGIVVFNKQHKVLLCKRNDVADSWQFPQGGIDEGETPKEAAFRELKEETSLTEVTWVTTLTEPARYRFTPEIIASMQKRGYNNVGQDMYWTLFYFDGDDREINLNTAQPEFDEFCWTTLDRAYDLVVDFKKPAYQKARTEFQPLIDQYKVTED
ncbi:MAG: RNA pyrophosphohydrolase [Alphaproteobacteria bacterium]